jgi:hypothetical protein
MLTENPGIGNPVSESLPNIGLQPTAADEIIWRRRS